MSRFISEMYLKMTRILTHHLKPDKRGRVSKREAQKRALNSHRRLLHCHLILHWETFEVKLGREGREEWREGGRLGRGGVRWRVRSIEAVSSASSFASYEGHSVSLCVFCVQYPHTLTHPRSYFPGICGSEREDQSRYISMRLSKPQTIKNQSRRGTFKRGISSSSPTSSFSSHFLVQPKELNYFNGKKTRWNKIRV